MNEIRVLTLSGTPRERGVSHGQLLQDRIHDLNERLVRSMEAMPRAEGGLVLRFPESTLLAYARAHAPAIGDYAPELLAEMEGIAEGAEIPFDRILLLNCVAEVRRLFATDYAAQAIDRSLVVTPLPPPAPALPGCTCLAAQGDATRDGQVIIGQTYDTDAYWEPVVFRIREEGAGPEQLVMGHAGILAEFGINSAGLAFVASGLLVTDQRPGVPAPVVARKLLEQTRLGDALDAVIRAKRTIGISYLLASPFGVVDLETSAADYDCHYLQGSVFACANHVRSPALKHLQAGLYGADTFVRQGRAMQLLRASRGVLDLDSLKAIQRDHADYPLGICRHAEGAGAAMTRCAVLLKPAERLMLITDGNPCEMPYRRFELASSEF
jgi:isopenicillin-N N-acyltransferase-like protein